MEHETTVTITLIEYDTLRHIRDAVDKNSNMSFICNSEWIRVLSDDEVLHRQMEKIKSLENEITNLRNRNLSLNSKLDIIEHEKRKKRFKLF